MQSRGPLRRTCLALIVAAALTARTASLQNQPPPTPQTTFRTEANYVRVDVYPTKDDAPVLDLTQEDFEVLEAGVPQKIEQFERVQIRGNLPQDQRIEPSSVEAGRQAAQNPRARVFVVFLDVNHVSVEGSHRIRQPLVDTLNRLIGPDDVFAVMTPEMSARDITFARRTTTIEGYPDTLLDLGRALPDFEGSRRGAVPRLLSGLEDDRGVAEEMIERRREKLSLDAICRSLALPPRRPRRAQGSASGHRRVAALPAEPGTGAHDRKQIPQTTVAIDPRTGRLTADQTDPGLGTSRLKCESDRQMLANIDNEQDFRALLDDANGANASFYPIDPRGLAVFDEPIGRPTTGLPRRPLDDDHAARCRSGTAPRPARDAADACGRDRWARARQLERHQQGFAAGRGRSELVLSARLLLVRQARWKISPDHGSRQTPWRPGARAARISGRHTGGRDGVCPRGGAGPHRGRGNSRDANRPRVAGAVSTGVAAARARRDGMARSRGWWRRGGLLGGRRVLGERTGWRFDSAQRRPDVDVTVISASGATVGRATGRGGTRSVMVPVRVDETTSAGSYTVRVRAEGFGVGTVQVQLPSSPDAGGAIFMRRGPTTGNKDAPAADLRFRRNERIRVDLPAPNSGPVAARLLDRLGKALPIPLTASVRDDADGSRWQTTELALAPLAAGDYLIELASGAGGEEKRTLVAFRVVP